MLIQKDGDIIVTTCQYEGRIAKSIVVFSGGMDSTTLLVHAMSETDVVKVLSFDYGQKHKVELERAKMITSELGLSDIHEIVDLTSISSLLSSSALLCGQEVPHELYDHDSQQATVVPNRNLIMLSIATACAINIGADIVFYGAHTGDHTIYPDCRAEFVEAVNTAVQIGMETNVEIIAPFINISKSDIAGIGIELCAPLHLAWSCYEGAGPSGENRPCLGCGTCMERTEAFLDNGTVDPALSAIEWMKAVELYKQAKERQKND